MSVIGAYPAATAALRSLYFATAELVDCTRPMAASVCAPVGAVVQFGVCIAWPFSVSLYTVVNTETSAAGKAGPV